MNNEKRKKEQEIIESEVVSEEMQIQDQDKRLNTSIFNDLNEEQQKEVFSKFIIKLYIEIFDPKHTPQTIIEFFPQFDLKLMITKQGNISIIDLVKNLKKLGFQLDGKFVSYYSFDCEMFINCGIDPIHQDIQISLDELVSRKLRLRFQSTGQSLIHMVMSEEMNEAVNIMKEGGEFIIEQGKDNQREEQNVKHCRRTKERRIGYIIDKVKKWRDYYNGKQDEFGNMVRLTLDEAAKKVAISKKSLDDYLLQIRHGRKYNFNFNEHKNEKVGSLRAFVKKHNISSKGNKAKVSKKQKKQSQDQQNNINSIHNP